MLSAKTSTSSLFFSPESSCISVTEIENSTPKHPYYTRLSARQSLASRSGPSLISASSSRTLYKPCLSGTLSERRSSAQFLYFERDNSVSKAKMDWTSDRCRPSPLAAVPKYIVAALCIGAMGFMMTFLNQKFQENRDSYVKIRDELSSLQNEVNTIKVAVQEAENIKEKAGENLSKIEKTLENLKNSTKVCQNATDASCKDGIGKVGSKGTEDIQKVVNEALEQYDSDKTGKTDFALESAGGSIVSSRGTENYQDNSKFSLLGITICEATNGPRAIIQAGVLPGECWAIKGSTGSAVIRLLGKVFITGVSLEHISKTLSPTGDITTAPKEFSVWGLNDPDTTDGQFFGQFIYNSDGPRLQHFEIPDAGKSYQYIEFKVHSNHGNPEYTCVYRLRVHGKLDHLRRGGKL